MRNQFGWSDSQGHASATATVGRGSWCTFPGRYVCAVCRSSTPTPASREIEADADQDWHWFGGLCGSVEADGDGGTVRTAHVSGQLFEDGDAAQGTRVIANHLPGHFRRSGGDTAIDLGFITLQEFGSAPFAPRFGILHLLSVVEPERVRQRVRADTRFGVVD